MKKLIFVLVSMLFALQIQVAEAMWSDNPKVEVARAAFFEWQARFVNAVMKPEMEKLGRNPMRYIAKVSYSEKQLADAEANYANAMEEATQQDPGFVDLKYRVKPSLNGARQHWADIVKEVGAQTVAEADAAFPDKEMLKHLTIAFASECGGCRLDDDDPWIRNDGSVH